ncbi:MAG: hypothetical protein ABI895_10925 [Deltaproteobacteria bacterium]
MSRSGHETQCACIPAEEREKPADMGVARRETASAERPPVRRVQPAMDLELHQLDRRYEALRTRSARRERRLLASVGEAGQQAPIIVVRDGVCCPPPGPARR